MTPITQICLDLDEVLCDFVGPALRLHGLDPANVLATWPAGEYSMHTVLAMGELDFWNPILSTGYDFFLGLPLKPWAEELLDFCGKIARVTIVSRCTHGACAAGKMDWLERHGLKRYLIGPAKDTCAHSGSVLIDDWDQNCEDFAQAGGRGILFPRIWNPLHGLKDDPMAYVRRQLKELSNGSSRAA